MTSAVGDPGSDDLASQREAQRQDRYALGEIVRHRHTCEATGAQLDVEDAVAMLVRVSPGVSRLAVVSGTHWDSGKGALSATDPAVDPDVLDGRTLFGRLGRAPYQPVAVTKASSARSQPGATAAASGVRRQRRSGTPLLGMPPRGMRCGMGPTWPN